MWLQLAIIALLLVGLSTLLHYEALHFAVGRFDSLAGGHRQRVIRVILIAFASHLAHVTLFAAAFYGLERIAGFGTIGGGTARNFGEALYFSLTSYTTMGLGDLFPTGALRLLSGLEALVGLVMVAWTASFTFLAMQRAWDEERR